MIIEQTGIEGLFIIKPRVFEDERGYFFESYNKEDFIAKGVKVDFVQDNQSMSNAGVLRGLHFQQPPYAQAKLVRVIKGAVLDVVVDIRKKSETYGKHYALELNEKNKWMMLIPEGFAHGFLTLQDQTIFSYKCSSGYNKDSEGAILWNDSDLDIPWGIETPVLSPKDKLASPFKNFLTPFS